MKKLIGLITFLILNTSNANLHLAPPNFEISEGKAVFIDILNADYFVDYNTKKRKAYAESTLTFKNNDTGFPIFDLIPSISEISLDGEIVHQRLISLPDGQGSARVVLKEVSPGTHTLKMKHLIDHKTSFRWPRRGVKSGFFIRDLKARKFLEQYLPTNLEFDQYPMNIETVVTRTNRTHKLVANGKIEEMGKNHFKVTYPEFYTASSVYFHIFPKGKYKWKTGSYTSIDGREIAITIYAQPLSSPTKFYREAHRMFKELENDYGPWPYDSLLVFATGIRGGMEWPAATTTAFTSLDHEMLHSYFAKGVFPVNGNSGWMDEAIASWRDYGYQRLERPLFDSINLGNHSPYKRNTDSRSYEIGRSFLAFLDYKFQNIGGLKPVLKEFFNRRKFTPVSTKNMIEEFEDITGLSLQADFDYYVLGMGDAQRQEYVSVSENPHHPELTQEELDSLIE